MNMWVTNCQGWKKGEPGYVPASNGTAASPSNPEPKYISTLRMIRFLTT